MKKVFTSLSFLLLATSSILILPRPVSALVSSNCETFIQQNKNLTTRRGLTLEKQQVAYARLIMGIAKQKRLPEEAAQVAIIASLQASSLRNSQKGLFQQQSRFYPGVNVTSPQSATNAFFDRLNAIPRWQNKSLANAAKTVQSARSLSTFQKWEPTAKFLTNKWWGNTQNPTSCSNLQQGEGTQAAEQITKRATTTTQKQTTTTQQKLPSIRKTQIPNIVSVNGITVHTSISRNLQNLLVAAEKDGLRLTGSGFRNPERQIELRKQNCGRTSYDIYRKSPSLCSPPTAIPGRSNHEKGLAVDFRNCGTRSTICYKWLRKNAATYGLYNLPSEPWHWSTNGR